MVVTYVIITTYAADHLAKRGLEFGQSVGLGQVVGESNKMEDTSRQSGDLVRLYFEKAKSRWAAGPKIMWPRKSAQRAPVKFNA